MLEFEVSIVNVVAVLIPTSLRRINIFFFFNISLVPEEAKLVQGVFFDLLIVDKSIFIGELLFSVSLHEI